MDIQKRLIGGCSWFIPHEDDVKVDFDSLIWRLFLFEKYILVSTRLKEIPHLCDVFSFQGTKDLLSSGALDIYCDATIIGQTGQTTFLESRKKKGVLPLCSYSFSLICPHDRKEYIDNSLSSLNRIRAQSSEEIDDLKHIVLHALVERPPNYGLAALAQLKQDLINNSPLLKILIKQSIYDYCHLIIHPSKFSLTIHQIDDDDFRAETDLGRRLGLKPEAIHKIIESGILALSSIHCRFEDMDKYSSLTGTIEKDLPLFQERLSSLAKSLSPKDSEDRFKRVVDLINLPSFEFGGKGMKINIERLLEIRNSKSCCDFRTFLPKINDMNDKEIIDFFTDIKSRLSSFIQSKSGKIIRFLFTTALGLIPSYPGVLGGPIAGVLDTFIIGASGFSMGID